MKKAVVLLMAVYALLLAKPIEPGEKLAPMVLPDQFDKQHTVDAAHCSLLLLTAQKDLSIKLKDFLMKHPGFLQRQF